jgi:adenosylcobinamide-GDP ribazoletransferase
MPTSLRHFILAVQFLTRLPTPQLRDFEARELAGSAAWFPIVGVLIGLLITAATLLGSKVDSWLGALLGLLMWTWITGALHLDGLADLFDALGAAHRDPQRLLQVMRDPHVGSFGVVALCSLLISKLVLLRVGLNHATLTLFTLPLICAWSRLGAIAWSAWLPALAGSSTEAFTWQPRKSLVLICVAALMLLSFAFAPALMVAPLVLLAWGAFLKQRLGGMSGDCLGAGIEVTESALLLAILCVPLVLSWRL